MLATAAERMRAAAGIGDEEMQTAVEAAEAGVAGMVLELYPSLAASPPPAAREAAPRRASKTAANAKLVRDDSEEEESDDEDDDESDGEEEGGDEQEAPCSPVIVKTAHASRATRAALRENVVR